MFWVLIILVVLNSYSWSQQLVDYDEDDTQPTNINESFDVALEELWPLVIKNGLDKTKLPDITEGISYRPLFINYNAGILLRNGMVWNIRKVVRYGDVFMILDKKSLRLGGNVLIDKVDFSYDFNARIFGLSATGTVIGTVTDTIVAGEFSINLNDTNVILNDLQITSFGDIAVQLKSNLVVRWISEPFLRTITRLFQSRITTTVSDGVRDYTRKLLNDINDNDRLNIKKYFHSIIPILNTKGLFREVLVVSPPGDIVGKLNVGYQGWFTCAGDQSPVNIWYKWADQAIPSPGHQLFELWPDVREYNKTYPTNYANLGNGQPAALFSSWDDQTVQLHFQWISTYGIDGVALERFGANFNDPRIKPYVNGIANKVMVNAQNYNKKFYITYDISDWINFSTELLPDFTTNVLNFTKSPAYAKQNGKPVIGFWGLGVKLPNGFNPGGSNPGTPQQGLNIINFLKSKGMYVICGATAFWFTGNNNDTLPFLPVFTACDMISPWAVGAFQGGVARAAAFKNTLTADLKYCNTHNIDYQPVVWPGFAWSNWKGGLQNAIPRLHGDFMWQQFVNLRQLGITTAYVAMFDEYNEGTAIAKAAETIAGIPKNQYFLTLNADGVLVSSDFYLRLVNDGNKMIKGITALQLQHPTTFT